MYLRTHHIRTFPSFVSSVIYLFSNHIKQRETLTNTPAPLDLRPPASPPPPPPATSTTAAAAVETRLDFDRPYLDFRGGASGSIRSAYAYSFGNVYIALGLDLGFLLDKVTDEAVGGGEKSSRGIGGGLGSGSEWYRPGLEFEAEEGGRVEARPAE